MNREQILAKVIELAAEQAGVAVTEVSAATHFVNDLNYGSLDQVEFAISLEDAFGISIADEDAARVQTVGEAVEKVEEALREKNAQAA